LRVTSRGLGDVYKRQVFVRSPKLAELTDALVVAGAKVTNEDDGVVVTGLEATQVGHLAFVKNIEIHELSPRTSTLEEAFLELTAGFQEYQTEQHGEVAP
jgi:ABC-2 type transport system ATP-binding protein